MFCLPVDPLSFRPNFGSFDDTPKITLARTTSLCKLEYRCKMFNCCFYSPSVLHNADFRRTNSHTHFVGGAFSLDISIFTYTDHHYIRPKHSMAVVLRIKTCDKYILRKKKLNDI